MLLKSFTVWVLISFSSLATAEVTQEQIKNSLIQDSISKPLINERVAFKPIEKHHFNLEAPQSCGEEASIEKTATKIECQFHSSGVKKVVVSVCDDKKVYCKQEQRSLTVLEQKSSTPRMKMPPQEDTQKMQNETKAKLMNDFHQYRVEEAIEAMKGKKGGLVLVSTDWCPPCNMVKEFLLPRDEFKSLTKDYTLIYVDGDGPLMTQWRNQLKTFYYPSFVIVDQNAKLVDLKTSYIKLFEFKDLFEKSTEDLSNNIESLQARVDARVKGSFARKILDYFKGKEFVAVDNLRWIDYLSSVARFSDQLKYIDQLGADQYPLKRLSAMYSSVWFGKKSSEFDLKTREKKKREIADKMLNTDFNRNLSEYWMVESVIEEHCGAGGEDKKDQIVTKERCQVLIAKLRDDAKAKKQESWERFTKAEKLIAGAQLAYSEAGLFKLEGNKDKERSAKKICQAMWAMAEEFSPLKNKSRTARIESLKCIPKDEIEQSQKVVESLVKDYPYEYTFHTKLAKIFMKKKSFEKALKANSKAVRYAYGDSWAAALTQRVDILKALGRSSEALSLLEKSMGEISLDADSNKNWFMNKVRAQIKELKALEKKTL